MERVVTMIKGKSINLRTVRKEDLDQMFLLTSDLSQTGPYWNVRLTSEVAYKKSMKKQVFGMTILERW